VRMVRIVQGLETTMGSVGMSMMSSRPPKTAMRVAQRIVDDVVRSGATAGTSLPPERVMLETYEIGRGTLREALRLLEFQGVIVLKPGPRGGPVLVRPDAGHLATTLVLLMQVSTAPYRVIVEARGALEPMIGRLAAARITPVQLAELGASVTLMTNELHDDRSFFEANKKFHDVIAWASGNPLFGYLIDSLLGIMDGTVLGIDYPKHRRTAILKAHEEIYEALSTHGEDGAESRMYEHIEAYVRFANRKYPEVLNQVITWDKLN